MTAPLPAWLEPVALTTPALLAEPLSRHTTFGIGGPADVFARPATRQELAALLKATNAHDVPVHLLGSGSNCLVSDAGVRGLVISLAGALKELLIEGRQVIAESGVMLGHMVKRCLKAGLTGIESLVGVPGTVGGALVMNAGAFGGEISNHLVEAQVLTLAGVDKTYPRADLEFAYRWSSFRADEIIVEARFRLPAGDPDASAVLRSEASSQRKARQPLTFRSAGSVFKNPAPEMAAGVLIDQAGLKGTRRGAAEISPKHANFIVNHGGATAADVADLIKLAARKVQEQHGVQLQLEIKTIGFEPGFWAEAGLDS